jgi:hypothetical protein
MTGKELVDILISHAKFYEEDPFSPFYTDKHL